MSRREKNNAEYEETERTQRREEKTRTLKNVGCGTPIRSEFARDAERMDA